MIPPAELRLAEPRDRIRTAEVSAESVLLSDCSAAPKQAVELSRLATALVEED